MLSVDSSQSSATPKCKGDALDEKLFAPGHADVLALHAAAPRQAEAWDPPRREPGEDDPVPSRGRLSDLLDNFGRAREIGRAHV